jgi:hypothetical protein
MRSREREKHAWGYITGFPLFQRNKTIRKRRVREKGGGESAEKPALGPFVSHSTRQWQQPATHSM